MGAQQQGSDAVNGRWITIPRTLCIVRHNDHILLMKRAAHKRVFPNQYNGLGGHIERDEDAKTGAIREIKEESGLDVRDVQLRAIYNVDAGGASGIVLFVFTAWSDTPEFLDPGIEGKLEWLPIDRLDEYDLVEDLPILLPRILQQDSETIHYVHVSYDTTDQIVMRFANS